MKEIFLDPPPQVPPPWRWFFIPPPPPGSPPLLSMTLPMYESRFQSSNYLKGIVKESVRRANRLRNAFILISVFLFIFIESFSFLSKRLYYLHSWLIIPSKWQKVHQEDCFGKGCLTKTQLKSVMNEVTGSRHFANFLIVCESEKTLFAKGLCPCRGSSTHPLNY